MDLDKTAIDRCITREPDYAMDFWVEKLFNCYNDEFYKTHEEFLESDLANEWAEKLFDKGISPEDAAPVIERAAKLYKRFN